MRPSNILFPDDAKPGTKIRTEKVLHGQVVEKGETNKLIEPESSFFKFDIRVRGTVQGEEVCHTLLG